MVVRGGKKKMKLKDLIKSEVVVRSNKENKEDKAQKISKHLMSPEGNKYWN